MWVTFTHLSLGFYICKAGMTPASWHIWGSQEKTATPQVYMYVRMCVHTHATGSSE